MGSRGDSFFSKAGLDVFCDSAEGAAPSSAAVLAEYEPAALCTSSALAPLVFLGVCDALGRFLEGRSSSEESSSRVTSSEDSSESPEELTDSSSELEWTCIAVGQDA